MSDRRLPSKDELLELRSRGIVPSSPLALRLVACGAVAGSGFLLARTVVSSLSWPDSFAALREVLIVVLYVWVATSAVVLGSVLLAGLLCNGFFFSPVALSFRRRVDLRGAALSLLVKGAIGVALGFVVLYGFAGDVMMQLRVAESSQPGTLRMDGFLEILRQLVFRVIVGSLFLAILAAGAARGRFLWRHRVSKRAGFNDS